MTTLEASTMDTRFRGKMSIRSGLRPYGLGDAWRSMQTGPFSGSSVNFAPKPPRADSRAKIDSCRRPKNRSSASKHTHPPQQKRKLLRQDLDQCRTRICHLRKPDRLSKSSQTTGSAFACAPGPENKEATWRQRSRIFGGDQAGSRQSTATRRSGALLSGVRKQHRRAQRACRHGKAWGEKHFGAYKIAEGYSGLGNKDCAF